jgi:hypothetical protein
MAGAVIPGRALSIEELAPARARTEAVAAQLRARLERHLESLRPVLSPRRLLGRYVRGGVRDDALGADKAIADLREGYARICGRPFNLNKELGEDVLSVDSVIDLYPFEYAHKLEGGDRTVVVSSPISWRLGFRSGYTFAELRSAVRERTSLRSSDARQFLINALVLQGLLEKFPDVRALLGDLRYDVQLEKVEGMGELPCLTVQIASLSSFRPSDSVIDAATRLSGVPAFIELIDDDSIRRLPDPLRQAIEPQAR